MLLMALGLSVLPINKKSEVPSFEKPEYTQAFIAEAREVRCLADALYHEVRGEKLKDRVLMAEVILNRVDHPKYPKTICGVVHQRGQFQWVRFENEPIADEAAYVEAIDLAIMIRAGAIHRTHRDILWFYNPEISSARHLHEHWAKVHGRKFRSGHHVFLAEAS